MPKAKGKGFFRYLGVSAGAVLAAGCLFDSKESHLLTHSATTVVLDKQVSASATPTRTVDLYLPLLDNSLAAGKSGAPEVFSPVNIQEHATGDVVQYRLTRQRFGSWSKELEFKWNYFQLSANFFFA